MRKGSFAVAIACVIAGLFPAGCNKTESPPEEASQPVSRPSARPIWTALPTTAQAASNPSDPLDTPLSAVQHLFKLIQNENVREVRMILAEPLPSDQLRGQVREVANKMKAGATWAVVEIKATDTAAVALYKTTYPDKSEEIAPIVLLHRYERWRPMLGPVNLKKFTPGEKNDLRIVMDWTAMKLKDLQPSTTTTTKPAMQP